LNYGKYLNYGAHILNFGVKISKLYLLKGGGGGGFWEPPGGFVIGVRKKCIAHHLRDSTQFTLWKILLHESVFFKSNLKLGRHLLGTKKIQPIAF